MGEIINLNKARKARAKDAKAKKSAENRVRHGRTKAEKEKDKGNEDIIRGRWERNRIEPEPTD